MPDAAEAPGRRRDRSRHRSEPRFALPRPVGRTATILTAVLSLVPAVVATAVVQALSPAAQRVPVGAARFDLAGAWLATEPGALAGTTSWLTAPTLGRVQLGLLVRVLQGGSAQGVLAAAHGAMLLLAVLQVGLLWWVLRRRGAGGVPAGLAAALLGVAPVAVEAHAAVTATAVGMVWALVAALLASGAARPPALVAAGACGAVAIASVPALLPVVAGGGLLLALWLRGSGRARSLLAVFAGAGAAGLLLVAGTAGVAAQPATAAGAALDALVAAQGPVATVGAAAIARWAVVDPLALIVVAGAAVVAGWRGRDLPAVVLLGVAAAVSLWPLGADAAGPLVALLPVAAAVVARSADAAVVELGHPLLVRSVLGSGWLMGVAAVLVVGVVAWLVGLGALVRGADQPIAAVDRWVRSSVPAGQTVLVGLGVWPDLQASGRADVGWYAARAGSSAVPSSVPWRRADYVVADDSLPADRVGAAGAVLDRSLPIATFGRGAAALTVRAVRDGQRGGTVPAPTTAAGREAAAVRARVGRQLAENPRIELGGRDRARLLAGEVDTRVALVLAQFVTQHRVAVSGFGVAEGDRSGVRTTVTVREIDGRAVPSDGTKTGVLLRFLSDLQGDFATASIDATDDGITAAFAPEPDLVPAG